MIDSVQPISADGVEFDALDAMVRNCPFHGWLGVRLLSLGPHEIAITMPWRGEFGSDPSSSYAHGGILASLIDLAADYAIAARIGRGVPTVDLRIDYHRAAIPGTMIARATVIKLGATLATAEARIFDATNRLVASGRGVYLTLPPRATEGAIR